MKKFSKILEGVEVKKFYKIIAEIEIIVEAESDGEAGYKSDSILSAINESYGHKTISLSETTDRIVENKK